MTTSNSQSALLTHLRDRFNVGPENLATEALAFILNRYPTARDALIAHCNQYHPSLPKIDGFHTQDWSADDAAIPDLIGTSGHRTPLVIEVKFQAGLTRNQPNTYMQRLFDASEGGLLLFLVPELRLPHVWGQVKVRCQERWELREDSAGRSSASCGNVSLAVTSWAKILNVLDLALQQVTDRTGFWELQQLRSLCEYEDQQIFEPLSEADLDRRIGRRIGQYRDLAYEVIETVLERDLVDTKHLARVNASSSIGRYFRLKGWICWFGVHWDLWGTEEHQSPLWLFIVDKRAAGNGGVSEALRILRSRALTSNDGQSRICIPLPIEKDRDDVLNQIAKQIREIAELLPPPPSSPEPESSPPSDISPTPAVT